MFTNLTNVSKTFIDMENVVRKNMAHEILKAASSIGELVDEVNKIDFGFKISLETSAMIGIDDNERGGFIGVAYGYLDGFKIRYLSDSLFDKGYSEEYLWDGAKSFYTHNFRHTDFFKMMLSVAKSDSEKKKFRKVCSWFDNLISVEKEWKSINTVAINTEYKIYSKENVVVKDVE